MNSICKFCLHASCRSSNKCVNRYGKLSCTTRQQAQQTTTTESTIEPTTAVAYSKKYLFEKSNKLKKTKPTKKQLEKDIKMVRDENAKLNRNNVTLQKSTSTLTKLLEKEKNKNAKLTEEVKIAVFDDEDYRCCICLQLFIRPSLLGCTQMFCEWCILKWLEKQNHCPICRVFIVSNTLCVNMNNFIKKRMELMPAKIRLAFRDLEVARANEKESSIKIQAERRRLECIAKFLNGNPHVTIANV